jgi:hypothetical protein
MDSSQNRQRMADARQRLDDSRSQIRDSAEAMEQGRLSQAQTSATRAQRQLEQMRQELQRRTSSLRRRNARHAQPGPAARPARGPTRPGDRAAARGAAEDARGAERRQGVGGADRATEREHDETARRDEECQRPGGVFGAAAIAKALRYAARRTYGEHRPGAGDHGRVVRRTCCPRPADRRRASRGSTSSGGVEEAARNVLGDEAESLPRPRA